MTHTRNFDPEKLAAIVEAVVSEYFLKLKTEDPDVCDGPDCQACAFARFVLANPTLSRINGRLGEEVARRLRYDPPAALDETRQAIMFLIRSAMYLGFDLAWRYKDTEQPDAITAPAEAAK